MRQTHTGRYKLSDGALDDLSIATRQGQSVFEDADLEQYTTTDVLEAEQYMIASLDKTTGIGYKPGKATGGSTSGTSG